MKPWLKALMWFGIGAGLGFFAGDKLGYSRAQKEDIEITCQGNGKEVGSFKGTLKDGFEFKKFNHVEDTLNEYRGEDNPPEFRLNNIQVLDPSLPSVSASDEEPEMPTAEDIQIDPEIPQLHPQDLIPEIISEEEFNRNVWQYDLESLLFYEMDEVLYNDTTQSIVECPDQVVGVGTLFEFRANPTKEPLDTIYVKNETFGTLFRIDRMDAAFCDAVDGTAAPTDEDEPESPEEQDDYWNDV